MSLDPACGPTPSLGDILLSDGSAGRSFALAEAALTDSRPVVLRIGAGAPDCPQGAGQPTPAPAGPCADTPRPRAAAPAPAEFRNGSGPDEAGGAAVVPRGTGVGPEFTSDHGSGQDAAANAVLDFGTIVQGGSASLTLNIANITPDAEAGEPTALTILSTSGVVGGPGSPFQLLAMTDTTLGPADVVSLRVTFSAAEVGTFADVLTVRTDQGAALGTAGLTFSFALTGAVLPAPPLLPAPVALTLLGAGLLGMAMLRSAWRRQA